MGGGRPGEATILSRGELTSLGSTRYAFPDEKWVVEACDGKVMPVASYVRRFLYPSVTLLALPEGPVSGLTFLQKELLPVLGTRSPQAWTDEEPAGRSFLIGHEP